MPENIDLELRSEEVQEILTRVPNWIIRWGNVVLLLLVVLVLGVSWMIKYPDLISTKIIITTAEPPQKLISKSAGKIEVLFVKDKSIVSTDTPLAVLENAANFEDVFKLKKILDNNKSVPNFPFDNFRNAQLGDIENSYALFEKEYSANELNKKLQPYKVDGTAHTLEAIQLKERLNLLESQKSINLSELELDKKDFDRYQILFNKGIISAQELEKHSLTHLLAQKNYKNLLSSISSLKSSLNELTRSTKSTQINDNKETVNLDRNVTQAFYQLKKAIKDWELNYVLRSSIDGKVTFLQVWTENQTVAAGDNVFSIIPSNDSGYLG